MSRGLGPRFIKYKKAISKNPLLSLGVLATVLIFILGVIWRAVFIFSQHPITHYMAYSDMANYASEASRFFTHGINLAPSDTFYPPGASLLFGFLYHFHHSWYPVSWLLFVLSALTPLLLAGIGYLLYGRRVALISLVMASSYIGFVEYSGYLLSETPYIFLQSLAFLLLLFGLRAKTIERKILWGLGAGFTLGCTAIIRPVVLLPALLVGLVIVGLQLRNKKMRVWALLAGAVVGVIPFLVGFTVWCSHLNQQFCMISSNGSVTVLQGHYYNKVGDFKFYDNYRSYSFEAGDPAQGALGFTKPVTFQWGPYNQQKNLQVAKTWIKSHPKQALEYSFLHIYNLFRTVPWPAEDTLNDKHRMILSEILFRIFVLIPAAIYTLSLAIPKWRRKVRGKSSDLLVMAPIAGMALLIFITVGNPRYRVVFDGFFILLAARAYSFAGDVWSLLPKLGLKLRNKFSS